MSKPFLYLTQTKTAVPEHYEALNSARSRLIVGYWGAPQEGAPHLAGTTWTGGRNRLLQACAAVLDQHEYVIFLDDDIHFEHGDWRLFEDRLLEHRPLIAAPRLLNYGSVSREDWLMQSTYCFDACYNAFQARVIKDAVLLPYAERFDDLSWHYSQLTLIHLAAVLYPGQVVQFNEVVIANTQHSAYPQDLDFQGAVKVEAWLKHEILRPSFRRWRKLKPYLDGARSLPPMQITKRPASDTKKPDSLLRPGWQKMLHCNNSTGST